MSNYNKAYRKQNLETLKNYQAKYRDEHKDVARAYRVDYQEKHREQNQLYSREYYSKNREHIREQKRQNYENNKTSTSDPSYEGLTCLVCHMPYTKSNKARHAKSQKHKQALKQQTEPEIGP